MSLIIHAILHHVIFMKNAKWMPVELDGISLISRRENEMVKLNTTIIWWKLNLKNWKISTTHHNNEHGNNNNNNGNGNNEDAKYQGNGDANNGGNNSTGAI